MTSRRAMLAAMGGLPFARPDQHYEPPDAGTVPGSRSGIFRGRLVVIFGTGPGVGLFVYSPTPGFNNLVASIAAAAGTDPYGNPYLAGIATYGGLGGGFPVFSQLLAGDVLFGAIGDTTPAGFIANSGGNESLVSETVGGADLAAAMTFMSKVGSGVGHPQFVFSQGLPGSAVTNAFTEIKGTTAIATTAAGGLLLRIINTVTPTAPNVRIENNAAADPALGVLVTTDTFNRLLLDGGGAGGGRIRAGSGALAPDVALYRAAANQWAQDFTAYNNAGAAEVWQTVGGTGAAFAGTWANAAAPGVNLQYRRNAAPYQSVHWVGRVTNTVAQAAGSQITAAVAAAYRPSNTHDITCFNLTTGAVVRVSLGSTGILTCQSAIAANDLVGIPDTQIGLDA